MTNEQLFFAGVTCVECSAVWRDGPSRRSAAGAFRRRASLCLVASSARRCCPVEGKGRSFITYLLHSVYIYVFVRAQCAFVYVIDWLVFTYNWRKLPLSWGDIRGVAPSGLIAPLFAEVMGVDYFRQTSSYYTIHLMRVNRHELLFVEGGRLGVVTRVHICLKTMDILVYPKNFSSKMNKYISA